MLVCLSVLQHRVMFVCLFACLLELLLFATERKNFCLLLLLLLFRFSRSLFSLSLSLSLSLSCALNGTRQMMIRRIETTNTLSLSKSIIYSAFGILMLQTPTGIWGGVDAKTTNHVSSFSTPPFSILSLRGGGWMGNGEAHRRLEWLGR